MSDEQIKELFNSEVFKKTLDEYIINNLEFSILDEGYGYRYLAFKVEFNKQRIFYDGFYV